MLMSLSLCATYFLHGWLRDLSNVVWNKPRFPRRSGHCPIALYCPSTTSLTLLHVSHIKNQMS